MTTNLNPVPGQVPTNTVSVTPQQHQSEKLKRSEETRNHAPQVSENKKSENRTISQLRQIEVLARMRSYSAPVTWTTGTCDGSQEEKRVFPASEASSGIGAVFSRAWRALFGQRQLTNEQIAGFELNSDEPVVKWLKNGKLNDSSTAAVMTRIRDLALHGDSKQQDAALRVLEDIGTEYILKRDFFRTRNWRMRGKLQKYYRTLAAGFEANLQQGGTMAVRGNLSLPDRLGILDALGYSGRCKPGPSDRPLIRLCLEGLDDKLLVQLRLGNERAMATAMQGDRAAMIRNARTVTMRQTVDRMLAPDVQSFGPVTKEAVEKFLESCALPQDQGKLHALLNDLNAMICEERETELAKDIFSSLRGKQQLDKAIKDYCEKRLTLGAVRAKKTYKQTGEVLSLKRFLAPPLLLAALEKGVEVKHSAAIKNFIYTQFGEAGLDYAQDIAKGTSVEKSFWRTPRNR